MRYALVLLALVGLLASPAAAAAAAGRCRDHFGAAKIEMAMPDMAGLRCGNHGQAAPCCDPARHAPPAKHDAKSCMQACAAMAGVTVGLPNASMAFLPTPPQAAPAPGRVAALRHHEPGGLERPPRPSA